MASEKFKRRKSESAKEKARFDQAEAKWNEQEASNKDVIRAEEIYEKNPNLKDLGGVGDDSKVIIQKTEPERRIK